MYVMNNKLMKIKQCYKTFLSYLCLALPFYLINWLVNLYSCKFMRNLFFSKKLCYVWSLLPYKICALRKWCYNVVRNGILNARLNLFKLIVNINNGETWILTSDLKLNKQLNGFMNSNRSVNNILAFELSLSPNMDTNTGIQVYSTDESWIKRKVLAEFH